MLKYQREALKASGELARHLLDVLGETYLSPQTFAWAQLASLRGLTDDDELEERTLSTPQGLMARSFGLLGDDGNPRLEEDRVLSRETSASTTPESVDSQLQHPLSQASSGEASEASQMSSTDRTSAFRPQQTLDYLPDRPLPTAATAQMDTVEAQRVTELNNVIRHSAERAQHFQSILTLRLAGDAYVMKLHRRSSASSGSSSSSDEESEEVVQGSKRDVRGGESVWLQSRRKPAGSALRERRTPLENKVTKNMAKQFEAGAKAKAAKARMKAPKLATKPSNTKGVPKLVVPLQARPKPARAASANASMQIVIDPVLLAMTSTYEPPAGLRRTQSSTDLWAAASDGEEQIDSAELDDETESEEEEEEVDENFHQMQQDEDSDEDGEGESDEELDATALPDEADDDIVIDPASKEEEDLDMLSDLDQIDLAQDIDVADLRFLLHEPLIQGESSHSSVFFEALDMEDDEDELMGDEGWEHML